MPDINGADDTSLRDALSQQLADPGSAPAQEPAPAEANEPAALTQPSPDRPRDESGRFAPRDPAQAQPSAQPVAKAAAAAAQPGAAPAEAQPQPEATDKPLGPPPGFSPTTKAAWNKPEWSAEDVASLKRDVAKRETEIERGFAKLRDYKDLDPYVSMATNSGTTLPEAVKRYVEAENFLERDPIGGLRWLCQNYKVDPRQLLGDGTSAQPQPPAQPNGQPQPQQPQPQVDLRPVMEPIMQELRQLRSIVYGDKQAQTQQTVSAFFADPANKYAENVADQMAAMIQSGQATDLKDAYDKACWWNPEIRGLLIKEDQDRKAADQAAKAKKAADQARQAGRSITGGMGAANAPGPSASDNLRATLEEQFASAARV